MKQVLISDERFSETVAVGFRGMDAMFRMMHRATLDMRVAFEDFSDALDEDIDGNREFFKKLVIMCIPSFNGDYMEIEDDQNTPFWLALSVSNLMNRTEESLDAYVSRSAFARRILSFFQSEVDYDFARDIFVWSAFCLGPYAVIHRLGDSIRNDESVSNLATYRFFDRALRALWLSVPMAGFASNRIDLGESAKIRSKRLVYVLNGYLARARGYLESNSKAYFDLSYEEWCDQDCAVFETMLRRLIGALNIALFLIGGEMERGSERQIILSIFRELSSPEDDQEDDAVWLVEYEKRIEYARDLLVESLIIGRDGL